MSHHSQASIAARRHSRLRQRQPDEKHEFRPSRNPDDDNCAICRRPFESAIHYQIEADE